MPPNFGDFRRKIEEKEMKNVSFCDTRQKEHRSENLMGKLSSWEKNLGFSSFIISSQKMAKKLERLFLPKNIVSLSPGNSDGWVEKSFPVVAAKDLTQARKSSARLVVWESLRRGGDTKIGKVGRKCPSVNVQILQKYRRRR